MRPRTPLAAVIVAGTLLAGCGDDDVDTSTGETTSSTADSETTSSDDESTPTSSTAPAAPALTVEMPPSLADASAAIPVDDLAWFATLHRVAGGPAAGHLGTGISPEPADVIDPQTSIMGNQALAAAHGVAGDLLDSPGDAEVLVNEETTVAPGRPAWHVQLRFHGPEVAADVDLVGFEDGGSFHYAVAVTQGLDDASAAALQDAVAAASTT